MILFLSRLKVVLFRLPFRKANVSNKNNELKNFKVKFILQNIVFESMKYIIQVKELCMKSVAVGVKVLLKWY